jgi:hypothetical protein
VRSEPTVKRVFAQFWGCKEEQLEPSYDAVNIAYATRRPCNAWFHTDQGDRRIGLTQVQGFVALTPQGPEPENGALVVRDGSHRVHRSYFKAEGLRTAGDWHQLSPEHLAKHYPVERFPIVHVRAQPGDLVLWDSRLLHYGRQPHLAADQAQSAAPHPRMAIYVCMKSRQAMTASMRAKKRERFENLRMTSHSPDEGRVFGEALRMFKKTEAGLKARVAKYAVKARARPDLVFPDATAVRAYLASRGVAGTSLICPA